MKILIEGPDSSGKTVLSKTLREAFNSDYVHFEYEPDENIYQKQTLDTFELVKTSNNIIVDRFIPSEIVYGTVLRDKARFVYDDGNTWLHDMLDCFDNIIFCLPICKEDYINQFKKMSQQRDELVKEIKQISLIYNYYQDLYVNLKGNYPEFANKIIRYDFFRFID